MRRPRIQPTICLSFASMIAVSACGDDSSSTASGLTRLSQQDWTAAVQGYADLVYDSYSAALLTAQAMETAIEALIAAPSEQTIEAARESWLAAREPYGQTEAYRFYGGPIDDPETGPEGLLNSWPLDENYIDYVEGADGRIMGGIINDLEGYPELDEQVIVSANEAGGTDEKAISTGYHAIEFLLWGQDRDPEGPGQRPYQDYLSGDGATAPNGERRARYLQIVSSRLVADLQQLVTAWDPASDDNYRAQFIRSTPVDAVREMLTGIGVLSSGEVPGERMDVALDTRDQEDEHSCFSDNTHRDIVNNVRGIENVYLGRWAEEDRAGIDSLVERVAPALDAQIKAELRTSVEAAEAIQPPFDREIGDEQGRARVQAVIDALRTQAATIVKIAEALGIDHLTIDLPN